MRRTTIRCRKRSRAALADLAGVDRDMPWGVDGCAVPNFALPLSAFARALAKMADPRRLSAPRAAAARRIVHAMTAHPELVSGTGRACAILMRAGRGRFAVKTGAEGVFAGIMPERRAWHRAQDRRRRHARVGNRDRGAAGEARPAAWRRRGTGACARADHQYARRVVGERRPAEALAEPDLEQL